MWILETKLVRKSMLFMTFSKSFKRVLAGLPLSSLSLKISSGMTWMGTLIFRRERKTAKVLATCRCLHDCALSVRCKTWQEKFYPWTK